MLLLLVFLLILLFRFFEWTVEALVDVESLDDTLLLLLLLLLMWFRLMLLLLLLIFVLTIGLADGVDVVAATDSIEMSERIKRQENKATDEK